MFFKTTILWTDFLFLHVNHYFIYILLKVTGSVFTRKTYFEFFTRKICVMNGLLQERKFYRKENRFICVSSKKFLRTSLLENTCERFPPQPPQVKTPGNLKALETYRNSFHTLASIGYIYRTEVFGWRLKRLKRFSLLSGLRTNRNSVITKFVICNYSCRLLSMGLGCSQILLDSWCLIQIQLTP